ncbi:PEGA domain-containing protein [Leptospira semungkisensis]|uniref:PEGA domain-containing protein n=1 Tax=Leptospira semungkisensis TaxID=2484985 RepID=A0A4R9G8V0_9LEPT|nr:PEGA domain-containing protein [Leptospira semungkisensis]TGK07685.1 PEGA domain-containing protein [Leptospira semungkisensis]
MRFRFPKKISAFAVLLSLLPLAIVGPIYGIDEYYRFQELSSPERIQFEKERKLCIFPLRNLSGDKNIDFYSAGYASVVYSGLKSLVQIYDESLIPKSIQYAYGAQGESTRIREGEWDAKKLEKLRRGEYNLTTSRDPRYLSLKVQPYEGEVAPDEGFIIPVSRKFDCFYAIYGEFEKKGKDEIQIRIRLRSSKDGSKKEFSHKTSVRRSYQELGTIIEEIRRILLGKTTQTFSVKTSQHYDSLVFLDGNYIGKTPLRRTDILAGVHDVRVTKNGFEDWIGQVDLRDGPKELNIPLEKDKKEGFVTITSEPSGAKVYLGSEYLGTTPLAKIPVKTGWNRIRLTMEDHVDKFKGVEVKKGETAEVFAKLRLGDSVTYYKNRKYLFLDHTYDDFAIYSLYGTLFFYAGYYYFNYRADQAFESIRPTVTITNFVALQNLAQSSPSQQTFLMSYFYQEHVYQHARNQFNNYRSLGGNFARHTGIQGGLMLDCMGLMLALTVTFYALGLDSETVEVGTAPVKTVPSYVKVYDNQYETESFAKFKMRF